jgi:hypothetical protein
LYSKNKRVQTKKKTKNLGKINNYYLEEKNVRCFAHPKNDLELKGIYASFVGQVKGQIQQSAIRACVE